VAKGAAVDVAEAHEDQPLHRLRANLHEGAETSAEKLELAQDQPHEAAESPETHIDQRGEPSGETRAIDQLFHSFTTRI
jgi:hypothetical protein